MGNPAGTNHLAKILTERMKEAGKTDRIADIGLIGKNLYLTTDGLGLPLEPDQYSVLDCVGELEPGDQVLVIWVYPEPIIAGKIKKE